MRLRFAGSRLLTPLALGLVALLPWAAEPAQATMSADETRALLRQLQEGDLWGEAVLKGGSIRDIKVDSLAADSVIVREVVGALHQRRAVYPLSAITSLRQLGAQRIPPAQMPRRGSKSLLGAMVFEMIPGAGYYYIGETRQGLALQAFTALAAGAVVATGREGAAGWAPLAAWIRVGSLLHLWDEVKALNEVARSAESGTGSTAESFGTEQRGSAAVGLMSGERGAVPGLQIHFSF